jgi:hypothetical protein
MAFYKRYYFKGSWVKVNGISDVVLNWNGEHIAGYLIHLNENKTKDNTMIINK